MVPITTLRVVPIQRYRQFVTNSNRRGEFPIIGRQGALCGNVNLAIGEFYATEHAGICRFGAEILIYWLVWYLHRKGWV